MEQAWNALILALIGTGSTIIALIGMKVRSNMRSIVSVEERLVIVEAAERKCFEENRRLQSQNMDQELRLRSQKHEIDQLKVRLELDAQPLAIAADMDGIIRDITGDVERLLGWRVAELIGKNVEILIPPDSRTHHHHGLAEAKRRGVIRPPTVSIVTFALRKDGSTVPVIIHLERTSETILTAKISLHRLVLLITMFLLTPGTVDAQRLLVRRAERVISRTPLPPGSAGAAFVRTAKIGYMPLFGPIGLFGTAGRGVVFEIDGGGEMRNPRTVRVLGAAALFGIIGAGVPMSVQVNRQIVAFKDAAEVEQFATRPHVQGSVKLGAAGMVPGVFAAKGVGPSFGSRPGTVVSNRTFSLGFFGNIGVMAEVIRMAPRRR